MTSPTEGPLPPELEGRRQEALSTAERVANLMDGLQTQLNLLTRRTSVNRALVVVAILLSIGLGFAIHQSNSAAHSAHAEVVARCQAGNKQKANEKKLWTVTVQSLEASSPPHTPAGMAAYADEFKRIDVTFALSDCQHIGIHASTP